MLRASLARADEVGAHTVAFPAISAGVYGYPLAAATRIAVDTVRAARTDVDLVTFVAFNPQVSTAFEAALATPT